MAKEQQDQKNTKGKGKGKGKDASSASDAGFATGTPAEVKEILGRAGSRGGLTTVMALIQDGRDKNKAIRRNVKGPVRIGDILMLLDTEIEAQRVGGGRRGKKK
ncbi:hypothetical protein HOA92_03640 [archaeon]|jgi:small subunit ribosomal protein S28e|nr:hypothetical protein [archaeon]MBT6762104.1 hypothetical protein [archaeon]